MLIVGGDKHVSNEMLETKHKKINGSSAKPVKEKVSAAVLPPASFYVDVNFPVEFLSDDRLGLTPEELKRLNYNPDKVPKVKANQAKFKSSSCDMKVVKSSARNALSQGSKIKKAASEMQISGKTDDVNMILQEEIKHGLEATNEFMNQVTQQMKLLTEHFKLIGDSKFVPERKPSDLPEKINYPMENVNTSSATGVIFGN